MSGQIQQNNSPCVTCPSQERTLCAAIRGGVAAHDALHASGWQSHERAAPGRTICARNEPCPDLFILCQGWAFRYIQLSNGRRQILSVLLPGDVFSTSMLFEDTFQSSVQALTEVRYSRMCRQEILTRSATNPSIWESLIKICMAEKTFSDELSVNLGQRTAEERIAYFILTVTERLRKREVQRDRGYLFPIRQQHIADISGLTSVYVSRIVKTFRDMGLLEWESGVLRILNQAELERIGRLR